MAALHHSAAASSSETLCPLTPSFSAVSALVQEEASKATCDALVEMLEAKYTGLFLADTKFLMSDTPTIADYRFAPLLSQAEVGIKLPERIETYLSDMMALEGYEDGIKAVDDYNKPHWQ